MIDVVCLDIASADAGIYESLYQKASGERRQRADRCLCFDDKLRCVAADALIKIALGTDDYSIEKNSCGKPYIQGRQEFFFNLSHSGRYVVIAYGNTEVGVDIQQYNDANMQAIAKRWFAPDEQAYIEKDTAGMKQRFFEIWTGKESYMKYLGTGLRTDMRRFSVLAPDPQIRYHHRVLGDDYSLSLCSSAEEYTFHLLDVKSFPAIFPGKAKRKGG